MEVLSHLAQLPVLVMSIEERGCPSPYPPEACGYASQRVKVGFYGNYALSMNVGHLQSQSAAPLLYQVNGQSIPDQHPPP